MTKITAEQARELAGPTVQERVEALYPLIEEAARNKKRSIYLTAEFWARDGYKQTHRWKEAATLLNKDGYKVHFFYEEKTFVNMGTIVEW